MIVDSSDGERDKAATKAYIREKGWTNEQVRVRVAKNLGNVLADVQEKFERNIMIIGGDTLLACLKRVGCGSIVPLEEPFPGVVVSKYNAGGADRLLISKSGGFGNETLLSDIKDLMEKRVSGKE